VPCRRRGHALTGERVFSALSPKPIIQPIIDDTGGDGDTSLGEIIPAAPSSAIASPGIPPAEHRRPSAAFPSSLPRKQEVGWARRPCVSRADMS
jgi:hypothetical protein